MTGKIEYIPAHLIDRDRWDDWIKDSVNRRIYATSGFLDILSPGWEAIVMDEGRAVMPVTRNRKYWISYVSQPLFLQQLGLFFSDRPGGGLLPLFLEKLSSAFGFIDISLNEMNEDPDPKFTITRLNNYLLPLDRPYSATTGGYSTNTRRNIIKAGRLGISLTSGYKPSEAVRMFMMNNAKRYQPIPKLYYRRLQAVLERGLEDGSVSISAARAMNGEIIATACFLKDFDRYVFYFSANTEEGRKQGAMFMLINSFIMKHSESGMMLDFNGSMNQGVARFYKGFGARQTSYGRLKINNLGFPLKYLR